MKINRKYIGKVTTEDIIRDIDKQRPGFKARVDARVQELGLARQVKALRQRRGLAQEALAEKAGTGQAVIARLEAGHVPKIDLLARIAFALGVDLAVELRPRRSAKAGT